MELFYNTRCTVLFDCVRTANAQNVLFYSSECHCCRLQSWLYRDSSTRISTDWYIKRDMKSFKQNQVRRLHNDKKYFGRPCTLIKISLDTTKRYLRIHFWGISNLRIKWSKFHSQRNSVTSDLSLLQNFEPVHDILLPPVCF